MRLQHVLRPFMLLPSALACSSLKCFDLTAGLSDILGDNFARGHAQASGGSVSAEAFKRLLKALGFDENGNTLGGGDKKRKQATGDDSGTSGKKTKTLMNFGFKKQSPGKPVEKIGVETKTE